MPRRSLATSNATVGNNDRRNHFSPTPKRGEDIDAVPDKVVDAILPRCEHACVQRNEQEAERPRTQARQRQERYVFCQSFIAGHHCTKRSSDTKAALHLPMVSSRQHDVALGLLDPGGHAGSFGLVGLLRQRVVLLAIRAVAVLSLAVAAVSVAVAARTLWAGIQDVPQHRRLGALHHG